jgi:inorganic pyrophosphatase
MSDQKVKAYIEIERFSNVKYEYDKNRRELVIDRLLKEPFIYPYAYGFIPNTIAEDGDDLDILIISDKYIQNDQYYDVYLIGGLEMEDEKGRDEKLLAVFEEDYQNINNIDKLTDEIKNNIFDFFSNYKNNDDGKWSKVDKFFSKDQCIELYKKSLH